MVPIHFLCEIYGDINLFSLRNYSVASNQFICETTEWYHLMFLVKQQCGINSFCLC